MLTVGDVGGGGGGRERGAEGIVKPLEIYEYRKIYFWDLNMCVWW